MHIEKYIKDKGNKYKIIIDGEEFILYEDVILKYNLLFKKEIDKKLFDNIMIDNENLVSYYECIKYINRKMRFTKEISDYLYKKGYNNDVAFKTISKLKENNFLNDELTCKCFVNDQINLTNNGYGKIKKELLKYDIDIGIIENYLDRVDNSVWESKIENYIEKKIRTNKNNSASYLKTKIKIELFNKGYDKYLVENIIEKYEFDDKDIYNNEYEKIKNKLSKKYAGYELELKIKQKMYQKGFRYYEER